MQGIFDELGLAVKTSTIIFSILGANLIRPSNVKNFIRQTFAIKKPVFVSTFASWMCKWIQTPDWQV
jgi:hypothetical protein